MIIYFILTQVISLAMATHYYHDFPRHDGGISNRKSLESGSQNKGILLSISRKQTTENSHSPPTFSFPNSRDAPTKKNDHFESIPFELPTIRKPQEFNKNSQENYHYQFKSLQAPQVPYTTVFNSIKLYQSPSKPAEEYGPPSKSLGETYRPPSRPSETYGPPVKPAVAYVIPQKPLPNQKPSETNGPPSTKPANSHGPPAKPAEIYGPPAKPAEIYEPPSKLADITGPPKPLNFVQHGKPTEKPAETYGPPKKPSEIYGPPKKPSEIYWPSQKPFDTYGPLKFVSEPQQYFNFRPKLEIVPQKPHEIYEAPKKPTVIRSKVSEVFQKPAQAHGALIKSLGTHGKTLTESSVTPKKTSEDGPKICSHGKGSKVEVRTDYAPPVKVNTDFNNYKQPLLLPELPLIYQYQLPQTPLQEAVVLDNSYWQQWSNPAQYKDVFYTAPAATATGVQYIPQLQQIYQNEALSDAEALGVNYPTSYGARIEYYPTYTGGYVPGISPSDNV